MREKSKKEGRRREGKWRKREWEFRKRRRERKKREGRGGRRERRGSLEIFFLFIYTINLILGLGNPDFIT